MGARKPASGRRCKWTSRSLQAVDVLVHRRHPLHIGTGELHVFMGWQEQIPDLRFRQRVGTPITPTFLGDLRLVPPRLARAHPVATPSVVIVTGRSPRWVSVRARAPASPSSTPNVIKTSSVKARRVVRVSNCSCKAPVFLKRPVGFDPTTCGLDVHYGHRATPREAESRRVC